MQLQSRLSFSSLLTFMDVCQTRNASDSAQRLGKSLAYVSTRLKNLEEMTGLQLLVRGHGTLSANEQGLSIGKSVHQIANICAFVQNWCRNPSANWQTAVVRIPMRFWGGGISCALMVALDAVRHEHPDIFLHCEFLDDYNDYQYRQSPWQPDCPHVGSIGIRYAGSESDIGGQWLLADNGATDNREHLIVPKMPWGIMQALPLEDPRFTYSRRDYTQWLAQPLADGETLLVNRLLLTGSLMRRHRLTPITLPHPVGLQCLLSGHHPVLAAFRDHFIAAFNRPVIPQCREARISARQWRYFSALAGSGRFGAAADQLCVTQPALSKQIRSMENTLGQTLIHRATGKRQIGLTPAGKLLADMARGIHSALDDLAQQISERRLRTQRELTIGILPSVDTQSALITTVMRHVRHWQDAHPDLRVHICEAPHYRLEELLRRLDIQLAITEADTPWLSQYPVFAAEPLGLVAPRTWFAGTVPDSMAWTALASYSLVLPGKSSGIRHLIDRHCLSLGITLLPAAESESLNLNRHWVTQGRHATILPASALQSLLDSGTAVFIPLHPPVSRQLKISHLRQRDLNADERSLLQALLHGA